MEKEDLPSQRVIHQPPSCIEFCPAESSIFVIGTYQLDDSHPHSSAEGPTVQPRSGRVEVYRVLPKALSSAFGISECMDKYDFLDCAVLDLHFHPQRPTSFAVCTSTSQIVFFTLKGLGHGQEAESIQPTLHRTGWIQTHDDPTVLATSFAWNPTWHMAGSGSHISFAVTFSSGETKVVVVHYSEISELSGVHHAVSNCIQASIQPPHSLEAWTVAFADFPSDAPDEKLLLTGGDDSILTLHPIHSHLDHDHDVMRTSDLFQDRKSHRAGVTAILPILDQTYPIPGAGAFVTGSYDEQIRLFTFERRPPCKPRLAAELHLGGGVWRLRMLSENRIKKAGRRYIYSTLILASCMHAGVRVVRVALDQEQSSARDSHWKLDVVGKFTEGHESMCYGADSVSLRRLVMKTEETPRADDPSSREESLESSEGDDHPPRDFVIVSTSFYDRKICVWSFHDEIAAVERVDSDVEAS